jgi:hypothetical protein
MGVVSGQRRCSKCGLFKDRKEFSKHKSSRDGLRSACKKCQSVRQYDYKQRVAQVKAGVAIKKCQRCGNKRPASRFDKSTKNKDGLVSVCKDCKNKRERIRNPYNYQDTEGATRIKNKEIFVDLMGGGCNRCGFNEFLTSLDFHHVNPEQKEYAPTRIIAKNFDKAYIELDKCALLCKNCHTALRYKLWTAEFIKSESLGYIISQEDTQ